MKHCLPLERFPSPAGLEPRTARSEGQRLTELAGLLTVYESRKENPQKLTQLSSRSHPRHLVEKGRHKKTSP